MKTFALIALLIFVGASDAKLRFTHQTVSDDDESIVSTSYGLVQGLLFDDHREFLSIPYARPPVDDLRWADPIPANPWGSNVLQATQYSAGCPQDCDLPPYTCPDTLSEDCLYLNVYTPRGATPDSKFPVLAFLPGGHFDQGTPGTILYSGEWWSNHTSTILVTIAYRLGALGWLHTNTLAGNFGFSDQRLALLWIKQNIEVFGGNPNQVVLFGQSAGATSTACHLVSPMSYNLFDAAIMESNPVTLTIKPSNIQLQISKAFAEDLNCDMNDVSCLRSKSIDEIITAQKLSDDVISILHPLDLFYPWTPTMDGYVVPAQPIDAFQTGKYNQVPLIFGTVSEEALLFIYEAAPNTPITEAQYAVIVEAVFGAIEGIKVMEKYSPRGMSDTRPLLSVLGTDYIFYCPTRYLLQSVVKSNPYPVYWYNFQDVTSFDPWGPNYTYCVGHVCHGSELPFVFNNVKPYYEFNSEEQILADVMATFWSNFVTSNGNVNVPRAVSQITWDTYDPSEDNMLVFATGSNLTTISNYRKSYCDFFDGMKNPYHYGT